MNLLLVALLACGDGGSPLRPVEEVAARPKAGVPNPVEVRRLQVEEGVRVYKEAKGSGDANAMRAAREQLRRLGLNDAETAALTQATSTWEGVAAAAGGAPVPVRADPGGFALATLPGAAVPLVPGAAPSAIGAWPLWADVTGLAGVPKVDGTGAPVQAGFVAERVAATDPDAALADRLAVLKLEDPRASVDTLDIDGRGLTRVRLRRAENPGRLVTYGLRTLRGADGAVWLFGAWVVGSSRDGGSSLEACGVVPYVLGHLLGASAEVDAVDRPALAAVVQGWVPSRGEAFGLAAAAHRAALARQAEAASMAQRALGACEPLATAHDGLARALLMSRPPDVGGALQHARRAADLDARGGSHSLDTLVRAALAAGEGGVAEEAKASWKRLNGKAWTP